MIGSSRILFLFTLALASASGTAGAATIDTTLHTPSHSPALVLVAQKKPKGISAAQIQQMMQSGQIPTQYMQYVPEQYRQNMNGGGGVSG